MEISLGHKQNNFFIIFIIGVIVSYGIFTFVQQSDRKVVIDGQLDMIQEQLVRVDVIYTSCLSLYQSRERTPQRVREACAGSQGFISWVRGFSYDPKLKGVKIELLALAETVEDMTQTLSLHPNAIRGKELLDLTPVLINTAQEEVSKARRKILF